MTDNDRDISEAVINFQSMIRIELRCGMAITESTESGCSRTGIGRHSLRQTMKSWIYYVLHIKQQLIPPATNYGTDFNKALGVQMDRFKCYTEASSGDEAPIRVPASPECHNAQVWRTYQKHAIGWVMEH